MRAGLVAIGVALFLLSIAPAAFATSRRSDERPPATVSAPPPRGLLHRFLPGIASAQRDLASALSERTRALGTSHRPPAFIAVMLLALASGALLAAGPGHGKMVIASFFLARGARVSRAISVGSVVGLLQVVSAIAAVWILAVALGRDRAGVLKGAAWIDLASYGLVTLSGFSLAVMATAGRARYRAAEWSLVVATGLTPSAGTMAFLLFALANGVPGAGVAAALAMALGIALTLSAVALFGVAARTAILGAAALDARAERWARCALPVIGSMLICAAGAFFSWGVWSARR